MQRITATVLTALTVLAATPVVPAAQTHADVALLVHVVDYFGETYIARPSAVSNYVFFPGDVITLRIELANRGTQPVTLRTQAPGPAQSLSFDAPAGVTVSVGSSVRLRRLGGEVDAEWRTEMLLDRNEALLFDGELRVEPTSPRNYVVNLRTELHDSDSRPVAPQAPRVQFEIRGNEGAAAEQSLRRASRAIVHGDDSTASQWIASLLETNPQSFAAHILRARLAERNNDARGATQSYERALMILDSDADIEYLRWVTDRGNVQNRADELRALIRRRTRPKEP